MKTHFFNFRLGLMLVTAFLVVLFNPTSTYAQLTRGSIAGTVHDQAGAVVAGAQVKIIDVGTNQTRETTTNEEGFYRVGALDPGTYTVAIETSGFSRVENRSVVVQTAQETTCLLYTSPSPRDRTRSRMPSSA